MGPSNHLIPSNVCHPSIVLFSLVYETNGSENEEIEVRNEENLIITVNRVGKNFVFFVIMVAVLVVTTITVQRI